MSRVVSVAQRAAKNAQARERRLMRSLISRFARRNGRGIEPRAATPVALILSSVAGVIFLAGSEAGRATPPFVIGLYAAVAALWLIAWAAERIVLAPVERDLTRAERRLALARVRASRRSTQ